MSARIYLNPRSIEYVGLFMMLSKLKDHGYDVPHVQAGKFYEAVPEAPPPIRPPATLPLSPAARRRALNFWRPNH